MNQLPQALSALNEYPQFILWKLVPATPKPRKVPINPQTLQSFRKEDDWQNHPELWVTAEQALTTLQYLDGSYGLGFLFTPTDPFFFVDIDGCLEANGQWGTVAQSLMGHFPGAAIEVSQSNTGLHIFGKYTNQPLNHAKKNIPLNIELYTEKRFVAMTMTNIVGDINAVHDFGLQNVVNTYFVKSANSGSEVDWTTEPVPEWDGFTDDAELITKALESGGAKSIMGNKASFKALWEADVDALAGAFPDQFGDRSYDGSSADAALAQHLSFWTGRDCDRINRLMLQSALVREKWDREDYLQRTIMSAVNLSREVYGAKLVSLIDDKYGAVKLRASSEAQRGLGDTIRESIFETATTDEQRYELARIPTAKTFIEHKGSTAAGLLDLLRPAEVAAVAVQPTISPKQGAQIMSPTMQQEYFAGCTYIIGANKVFVHANGTFLNKEAFNVAYGGWSFVMDIEGTVTKKAWEAFTESQCVTFPKVDDKTFRPDHTRGEVSQEEGLSYVNTYVPVENAQVAGDVTLFHDHLAKLLPNERDRTILLSYMAAMVQHKGSKFTWSPVIQGTPGNGKTTINKCLEFALGRRFTHRPKSTSLKSNFNGWMYGKLLIVVEDVYVSANMMEDLKSMITADTFEVEAKGVDQVTQRMFCNFIFNTNDKSSLRKHKDDRRFAMFYTAQQTKEDLIERDGMDSVYFKRLQDWLEFEQGFEAVNHLLHTFAIPNEFNPAKECLFAPVTTSTEEAITASVGNVEQIVLEAVDSGEVGFKGGWISSEWLGKLLKEEHIKLSYGKRGEMLEALGYIKHPALSNGRTHNPIPMEGNKKPTLYVKKGHINLNQKKGALVAKLYVEDQMADTPKTPAQNILSKP